MARTKPRRRSLWKFVLPLLVVGALLPVAALFFSEPILCVQNAITKGDAIVVLGGDSVHRPPRALELYRQGVAPRILISGTGDFQEVRTSLVGKGVPPESIEIEGDSASTKQNAEFSVRLLRARGVKRAIIVTSWFHSRRALNCFRHYAPDIEFVAAPTVADQPKAHWPDKYERGWVLSEYAKLAEYWLRYGVCPF